MKKKICWVTPDCFIDVDIPIVSEITDYDIHWIVLFNNKGNRFNESSFERYEKCDNVSIEFVYNKSRGRYPQTLLFYHRVKSIIKREKPDIIYFNVVPSNPYMLPLYFWLPKDKTIVTAHDGRMTASMSFAFLTKFWFYKAFRTVKHVNMFSNYQATFFNENFPAKDVTIIPLCLKDFGKPTVEKRKDCIGFVFFGTIHMEKNIELLIEAGNQLFEDGVRGFKISINGEQRVKWNIKEKIRHPEVFELYIGSVLNKDIPNLFAYNHYAVYPYKNMSQSGALKCAYNYYTPVIVSDLPGFIDEVENGIDGFVFKSESVEDLKKVMKDCIYRTRTDYDALVLKIREHISKKYAKPIIVKKYIDMFDKMLK